MRWAGNVWKISSGWRKTPGLESMFGYALPSPEAARKFLYWFHDEGQIEQAQRELKVGESSYEPAESAGLEGLSV
jgi:hypothetical protein